MYEKLDTTKQFLYLVHGVKFIITTESQQNEKSFILVSIEPLPSTSYNYR
jgi:hypothetical protein